MYVNIIGTYQYFESQEKDRSQVTVYDVEEQRPHLVHCDCDLIQLVKLFDERSCDNPGNPYWQHHNSSTYADGPAHTPLSGRTPAWCSVSMLQLKMTHNLIIVQSA